MRRGGGGGADRGRLVPPFACEERARSGGGGAEKRGGEGSEGSEGFRRAGRDPGAEAVSEPLRLALASRCVPSRSDASARVRRLRRRRGVNGEPPAAVPRAPSPVRGARFATRALLLRPLEPRGERASPPGICQGRVREGGRKAYARARRNGDARDRLSDGADVHVCLRRDRTRARVGSPSPRLINRRNVRVRTLVGRGGERDWMVPANRDMRVREKRRGARRVERRVERRGERRMGRIPEARRARERRLGDAGERGRGGASAYLGESEAARGRRRARSPGRARRRLPARAET